MVDGTSMTSSGSSSKCAQVVLHVCTAVWTQWIRIRKAGAGVLKSDMPKQRGEKNFFASFLIVFGCFLSISFPFKTSLTS